MTVVDPGGNTILVDQFVANRRSKDCRRGTTIGARLAKITGIGASSQSKGDSAALAAWYQEHLAWRSKTLAAPSSDGQMTRPRTTALRCCISLHRQPVVQPQRFVLHDQLQSRQSRRDARALRAVGA